MPRLVAAMHQYDGCRSAEAIALQMLGSSNRPRRCIEIFCCHECRCGWQEGQVALFKLALNPEPLVQHLLLSVWGGILR